MDTATLVVMALAVLIIFVGAFCVVQTLLKRLHPQLPNVLFATVLGAVIVSEILSHRYWLALAFGLMFLLTSDWLQSFRDSSRPFLPSWWNRPIGLLLEERRARRIRSSYTS